MWLYCLYCTFSSSVHMHTLSLTHSHRHKHTIDRWCEQNIQFEHNLLNYCKCDEGLPARVEPKIREIEWSQQGKSSAFHSALNKLKVMKWNSHLNHKLTSMTLKAPKLLLVGVSFFHAVLIWRVHWCCRAQKCPPTFWRSPMKEVNCLFIFSIDISDNSFFKGKGTR